MFKFLHAADIHLDSPLRGLDRYEGAPVDDCRRSTRKALENLVALAVAEQVAFVLIVGDVYDGDWPDYNTGLFFSREMTRLRDAGIPVYLIRGNHDAQNRMTRDLRLPSNVTELDQVRPQTLHLDDWGVALHGQSYARWDLRENLAKAYPASTSGLFNIGLLHTGVDGREGHEKYAPCTLDDMRARGYDYWALGHIHQRESLRGLDPLIAFPGNIQGRHVREHGPKGCLIVTVDDGREPSAKFHALDVMRWRHSRLDATGAIDADELLQRFRGHLDSLLPEADDRWLALRVEFAGACAAHAKVSADCPAFSAEIRQAAAEATSGRIWVEKVVARTAPPADLGASSADGPLAELFALLDELRGDENKLRDLADRALADLKAKVNADLLGDLDPRALLDQVGPLLDSRLQRVAGDSS